MSTAVNPSATTPSAAAPQGGKPASGIGILFGATLWDNLVPGVHTLGGQGNTLAIETDAGIVLVDAGPGGRVTQAMIARLRSISDARIHATIYSHGHAGYNSGVPDWMAHAESRGETPPLIIGHKNVARRYKRYLETAGLQSWLNSRQFRKIFKPARPQDFYPPTVEVSDSMSLQLGERQIEIIASPSETDDVLTVWLPQERFLYGSAAMIRSIPNIGTPLRTLREPMRWHDTLVRLHALKPLMVVPEFGAPLTEPQDIEDSFMLPILALQYLRREVVARMNRGMSEREILADMVYPPELFAHKLMRPIYGAPDYIVRDIWRTECGWFDYNPTNLHPARPADSGAAVFEALGDPAAVLAQARALAAQGQTQMAMHVVDLVAQGPQGEAIVQEARAFKADLCDARSPQCTSIVSRQLLRSCAEDLRGLPIGSTREQDPPAHFSWD